MTSEFDPFADGVEEAAMVAANDVGGEAHSSAPSEPAEAAEELPPTPAFLIKPSAYGKGTADGVYLPDGTAVGEWLAAKHPTLDATGVEELLLQMGLDPHNANLFSRHRAMRDRAAKELAKTPAVQTFAQAEALHRERTEAVRAAFLAAQGKEK